MPAQGVDYARHGYLRTNPKLRPGRELLFAGCEPGIRSQCGGRRSRPRAIANCIELRLSTARTRIGVYISYSLLFSEPKPFQRLERSHRT